MPIFQDVYFLKLLAMVTSLSWIIAEEMDGEYEVEFCFSLCVEQ